LKWAESEDGFIAPANQTDPFWMTSKKSKKLVHQWRAEEIAILVGTETAIKDNPSLTVREVKGKSPIRFVLDKSLRLPNDLLLFDKQSKSYILTEKSNNESQISVDFNNLAISICDALYQKVIQSIIIEGGAKTLQTFIDANLWDEARVFTVPISIKEGVKSPVLDVKAEKSEKVDKDQLSYFYR